MPGADLIKYTVEQAYKLFSATQNDDLEKIRKDIRSIFCLFTELYEPTVSGSTWSL